MERLDNIWQQVSASVCAVCVDNATNGHCRIQDGGACPLKDHFPRVVETIGSVRGATFAPYIKALRTAVCLNCRERRDFGRCDLRDNVGCPLDRYYHLVIQSVGEAMVRAA